MKLNLSYLEALKISVAWCVAQQSSIDNFGGYLGDMLVVRDKFVLHVNGNGEDGSRVNVYSKDEALKLYDEKSEWVNGAWNDDGSPVLDEDLITVLEAVECCGQDAKSLAEYLMRNSDTEEAC